MKKHCLPVLFIGLMTILCSSLAKAQIVKWVMTGAAGDEVFLKASNINTNVATDNTNTLNALRRGGGLRNTTSVGDPQTLPDGFTSTSTVKDGDYEVAVANNLYFEFSTAAKTNNYLHCNALIATVRRSGVSTATGVVPGVQWTYRIIDDADLGKINDNTFNTNNPFLKIGNVVTQQASGNGVQSTISIDAAQLKNVAAGKTVFFRLYIWGFSNNTGNTFALRTSTNNVALSLEGTVDATLPVELNGFNAKSVSQGVQLAWQTVSENNNSHFDILKVSGAKTEKIGEVKGAGNSQTIKSYSFLDAKPAPGINYYQLRQVDLNGDQSLSEVVTAKVGFDNNDLTAFANGNQVTINAQAAVNGTAEVVLNDISGKLLLKKKVSLNAGKNSFSFPVSLAKGTYIATVYSAENGKVAQKFIY